MDPCSAARCVPACPVPRVASRFGLNVAGALPFGGQEPSGGLDGGAGQISGFLLREPTSEQSEGKNRVWVERAY